MAKKDKLIERLKSRPRDFTFAEMETLLLSLGFKKSNKGKTSGSRVEFVHINLTIHIHKPHPQNTFHKYLINKYLINEIVKELERAGLI